MGDEVLKEGKRKIMGKINVKLEQCPNCKHCLVRKPNCRVINNLGYIVFYGKNGECTFFKKKG